MYLLEQTNEDFRLWGPRNGCITIFDKDIKISENGYVELSKEEAKFLKKMFHMNVRNAFANGSNSKYWEF